MSTITPTKPTTPTRVRLPWRKTATFPGFPPGFDAQLPDDNGRVMVNAWPGGWEVNYITPSGTDVCMVTTCRTDAAARAWAESSTHLMTPASVAAALAARS